MKTQTICPKCGKEVWAIVAPAHQGHAKSSIAAKSVTKFYHVPERIISVEEHGCKGAETFEQQLERIKKAGLPLILEDGRCGK